MSRQAKSKAGSGFTKNRTKWQGFERTILQIHQLYASPRSTIKYDDKLNGRETKRKRQIDISVRLEVSGIPILIVVECKDKARPIDAPEMGSFASLVQDVGAHKGVMVSKSGFTEAALNLARARLIDTQVYGDTGLPHGACVYVETLTLSMEWALMMRAIENRPFRLPPPDLTKLGVFSPEGKPLGSVLQVVQQAWEQSGLSAKTGIHLVTLGKHLIFDYGDCAIHAEALAQVHVKAERYIGPVSLEQFGLLSAETKVPIHDHPETGLIELARIWAGDLPSWIRVDETNPPAVTPMQKFIRGGWIDPADLSAGRKLTVVPKEAAYMQFTVHRSQVSTRDATGNRGG